VVSHSQPQTASASSARDMCSPGARRDGVRSRAARNNPLTSDMPVTVGARTPSATGETTPVDDLPQVAPRCPESLPRLAVRSGRPGTGEVHLMDHLGRVRGWLMKR